MITVAYVKLWGETAGAIAWNPDTGLGSFEFEPAFLKAKVNISPFTMPVIHAQNRIFQFPELRNNSTFKGLPGLVADSMPDRYGNTLINTWLQRQGRAANSLNPLELLCFIGNRGIGALEFEPAVPESNDESFKIEISSLIEVAQKILAGKTSVKLRAREEKSFVDILKIGTSAGGARAKALISYNDSTSEIRSGQADAPENFEHWLIKFDGIHDSQFGTSSGYGRVEMAYYLMAVDTGIEMTECRLLEENGRAHFMTKRFDRNGNKKIHFQSFCALRHFDFNEINVYSYEDLFETMRSMALPFPQAEELFRRMVFNVMARNCDDHTKNFSFLMSADGVWKLSPAYDVCHAYRPDSTWVSHHALSINGKRENISRNDLMMVGKMMNIKSSKEIIDRVAEVTANWDCYAKQTGVEVQLKKAIGKTLLKL